MLNPGGPVGRQNLSIGHGKQTGMAKEAASPKEMKGRRWEARRTDCVDVLSISERLDKDRKIPTEFCMIISNSDRH